MFILVRMLMTLVHATCVQMYLFTSQATRIAIVTKSIVTLHEKDVAQSSPCLASLATPSKRLRRIATATQHFGVAMMARCLPRACVQTDISLSTA
jgi:hypothetical protein